MKMGLSVAEGRVLHGLLEEASGDIVIRLDAQGFIVYASENVEELGHDLSSLLLMPHISDLAERDHAASVHEFADKVLTGDAQSGWIEFPVVTPVSIDESKFGEQRNWYALSLRLIDSDDGVMQGALGLIRSVQHKRSLEGELHSRSITDPLTGLANRQAFCASMRRHLARGGGQIVAVFAIDRMRAMFMQYGQRTADEIMWGFAKFLETMALPGHELAQLDGERFGVILSEMDEHAARQWAVDVLQTFSSLAIPSSSRAPQLSASAGIAPVECTVDWTLQQAELALVMARAGGGQQVGQCGYQQVGASYAQAMQPGLAVGVAATGR